MYLHFQFPQAARQSRQWPEDIGQEQLRLQHRRYFEFENGTLCCQWQDRTAVYRGRIWQYRFQATAGQQYCSITNDQPLLSLVFVTEGQARLYTGDQSWTLEQGRYYLFYLRRHTLASLQFNNTFCAFQVDADIVLQDRIREALPYAEQLQTLQDKNLIHKVPLWGSGRYPPKLAEFFNSGMLSGGDFVAFFTRHIISLLYSFPLRLDAGPARRITDCCQREEIYDYIRDNLETVDLLKGLPAVFHMSRRRLERLFAPERQGLSAFIRRERMELAMRQLKDGKRVKEVAMACGMDSLNSFSRAFRQYWHKAPMEVRYAT